MKDLDDELWALGIPAKTKHNEVAPCQHELAPVYGEVNEAIDQNLVMMEKMKLIASRHDLVCLLHEKPFEGINGSGKHNNWSLGTESENLLDPGDTPLDNLQFIVFLTAVIEAVDNYQELLRASVASAGNDHRLGANEAPPAIMSIFLGDQLTEVVEKIIDGKASVHATRGVLDLGADTLPKLMQDNTDRNRLPSPATSSSSVPAAPSRTSPTPTWCSMPPWPSRSSPSPTRLRARPRISSRTPRSSTARRS
jgi:glutamine synthetase